MTDILFVVLMGMGTVFFGLVCIIFLTRCMGWICKKTEKPAPCKTPAVPLSQEPAENRQEMIAAIAAAIAEDLGTDVSGIRILSVKKLSA